MKLIIFPKDSFTKKEKRRIKEILILAKKLLKKNKITLPKKIYFFNSFSSFIKKVIPEVKNYGFDEELSKEIILCALNNGTYGTINYNENSIIEMNFNPFNKGEYLAEEFMELIIHESLHLHLSKRLNKDLNLIKFKFEKGRYIGNPKIIQLDEGYAEFMTKKILNKTNITKIKNIKIPLKIKEKPIYKRKVSGFNVVLFDKNFEKLIISNRNLGLKYISQKFNFKSPNEKILTFVIEELKKII